MPENSPSNWLKKAGGRQLDDLPKTQWMLADRGYDADWYRDALQSRQEPSGVTIIVAMLPTCVAMTGRPAWSASMITIGIHSAL